MANTPSNITVRVADLEETKLAFADLWRLAANAHLWNVWLWLLLAVVNAGNAGEGSLPAWAYFTGSAIAFTAGAASALEWRRFRTNARRLEASCDR